jgi:hypothetical protein
LNAQAFGHIRADCGNLKKGKGKANNVTLSDESEEEAPESEKFLAFVAPHAEEEDSYYLEHGENGEELKEAYKTLYIEYEKLREGHKQHLYDLNSLQTEKSSLLLVFVLAAFCWTKSLLCNVAAFTGMMLYPESTLQLCSSRRFYEVFKDLFRFPVNRPDDVVFRPDAHQSATSVRTPIGV